MKKRLIPVLLFLGLVATTWAQPLGLDLLGMTNEGNRSEKKEFTRNSEAKETSDSAIVDNRKWVLSKPQRAADEITICVSRPPEPLDWSSPHHLMKSVRSNSKFLEVDRETGFQETPIGHCFVKISCSKDPHSQQPIVYMTGMTSSNPEEEMALLNEHGYGLGILGTDFEGMLCGAKDMDRLGSTGFERGTVNYMTFKVNLATTQRVIRYMNRYISKGCQRHFGTANRPRFGEGGGCSSFAVSIIEVAGLLDKEVTERWLVSRRIPYDLYGGPLTGLNVDRRECFDRKEWAKSHERHVFFKAYDPWRIHQWIRAMGTFRAQGWTVDEENEEGSYAISMDLPNHAPPTEAIWLDANECPNNQGRQDGLVTRNSHLPATFFGDWPTRGQSVD